MEYKTKKAAEKQSAQITWCNDWNGSSEIEVSLDFVFRK